MKLLNRMYTHAHIPTRQKASLNEPRVSPYPLNTYNFPWENNIDRAENKESIPKKTNLIVSNEENKDNNKPRYNEFGIQMISNNLYKQLFGNDLKKRDKIKINDCLQELKSYNFDKPQTPSEDIELTLPPLKGTTVEEHFYRIGEEQSKPYKELVLDLLENIPELPIKWIMQPGWTKYSKDGTMQVEYPPEDAMVFDVEVCCSAGPLPTLATAVTKTAWYGWVSKDLINSSTNIAKHSFNTDHLIPLESSFVAELDDSLLESLTKPRIAIGHNVSFDRAKVKEQYWLERTGMRFLDTMSLHVCISGVTSYQKALLKAGVGSEEWSKLSSLNSLGKVYELYCNKELSKSDQAIFVTGNLTDVRDNFQKLMTYCAKDVLATYAVMQKLFPLFLERFPHPVTLAGMLELQSTYVPVNGNWKKYLADSQQAYEDLNMEAKTILTHSANDACKLFHDDKYSEDLWLWDQDWTTKHLTLKKTRSKTKSNNDKPIEGGDPNDVKDVDIVEERTQFLKQKFSTQRNLGDYLSSRTPHLPGYPSWYKKLCNKPDNSLWIPEPELVSTGLKIIPKLLRLTWKSLPLHYEKGFGWGYLLPYSTDIKINCLDKLPIEQLINLYTSEFQNNLCSCEITVNDMHPGNDTIGQYICSKKKKWKKSCFNCCKAEIGSTCGMIRLPHKDGSNLNVGNPLSRDFINKFSENELSGASIHSKKIIEISRMLSYWRNNRERIENQFVCWLSNKDFRAKPSDYEMGVILPQVIVCGTLTRRAVEPTWMTVSNAIVERVGSELRGIVQAPPGYSLVGADVDSQELWIASLLGDAYSVGLHGATPFGWMTLNGQKSEGTDMHSVTAKAVGISRNHAKILNYARIYGAGQKFAERLLKQFNPGMTSSEASQKATKMMSITKGKRLFKLKNDCLPDFKERMYTKETVKEICSIHLKNVDEMFTSSQWLGGSESAMFNCLEEIANKPQPKTPFLNSHLSRALEPSLDNKDKFGSTRINWVVQSGAVDFLHLMLVSMRWFLSSNSRFCLSFHDEVRYLVPDKHKYEAALALHITNLLTRAFCVSRLGMSDLPQSVAFFSNVDVDVVLRKESNDDNKTPSNPFGLSKGYGVPIGESLNIYKSIEKAQGEIGIRQSCKL